jgi:hypothetical protein
VTPPPIRAHRYVRFGVPRGPWRATAQEAMIDALEDGQATEAHWPPHPITVTWPGRIERTAAMVATEPRSLTRRVRRVEAA